MDAALDKTLGDVRARIKRHSGSRKLNEENTKATLIEPVLRALGWDTEDLDEVQREYKVKRRDHPVDYALLELRTPRLLIEAKALGHDLSDHRWIGQIMGYATVAGVEWTVLTNGDEYRIYNAHAAVHVDEKLFRAVKVSEGGHQVADTLSLISKECLAEHRIEVLWRAHFVDRKVKAAVGELFSPESGDSLARLIRKATGLTMGEVRASLGRCHVDLSFPVESVPEAVSGGRRRRRKKTSSRPSAEGKGTTKSPSRSSTTLQDLIAAGLLTAPAKLVRKYKGKEMTATVNADGSVSFGRETFDSLSTAGGAARATIIGRRPDGRLPATNGWAFWRVRDASGELVPVEVIRTRFEEGGEQGRLRLVEGE